MVNRMNSESDLTLNSRLTGGRIEVKPVRLRLTLRMILVAGLKVCQIAIDG